jgi:hypothetical protein
MIQTLSTRAKEIFGRCSEKELKKLLFSKNLPAIAHNYFECDDYIYKKMAYSGGKFYLKNNLRKGLHINL